MNDEIEVRRGGVIEVDPAELGELARVLLMLARQLDASRGQVLAARNAAFAEPADRGFDVGWACVNLADRIDRASALVEQLAGKVRQAASLYEAVELRVQWELGDAADRQALRAKLDFALAGAGLPSGSEFERGLAALDAHALAAERGAREQLLAEADAWSPLLMALGFAPAGLLGVFAARALALSALGARDAAALGRVTVSGRPQSPGAPATNSIGAIAARAGAQGQVTLRPLGTRDGTAPAGLADAVKRIPGGGAERVRIEEYRFADGHREWAVYIAGTQPGGGEGEVFDMASNLTAYSADAADAASMQAVALAMTDAGVQPGDTLHLAGHSQGAMIAANVAALEGAHVASNLSVGNPVRPELRPETLSVQLTHGDEIVQALAAPSEAAGTGSADSVIVTRRATPTLGAGAEVPLGIGAHGADAYAHTASLFETSGDPRARPIAESYTHLATAQSVQVHSYGAERVPPPPADPSQRFLSYPNPLPPLPGNNPLPPLPARAPLPPLPGSYLGG